MDRTKANKIIDIEKLKKQFEGGNIMSIWEELNDLSHYELIELLLCYDDYVKEICDRNDGSVPSCLAEFYECDYPLLKKNYYSFEFVNAEDIFDDDNGGLKYGIDYLDEKGQVIDCEWFKTEEERQKSIE